MNLYIVMVADQPQMYSNGILAFGNGDVHLFPTYEAAVAAAEKTLLRAKEKGYDQWAILYKGYEIRMIPTVAVDQILGFPIVHSDLRAIE